MKSYSWNNDQSNEKQNINTLVNTFNQAHSNKQAKDELKRTIYLVETEENYNLLKELQAVPEKIVYKTKNLDMFKILKGNRSIHGPHLRNIVKSIRDDKDLLHDNPIVVNKHLEIIDGQTRWKAARILNKEIYFIIDPDAGLKDVHILNKHPRSWKFIDYMESFIGLDDFESCNYESYKELAKFCIDYKISLNNAVKLLMGDVSKLGSLFKSGDFVIKQREVATQVAKTLLSLKENYFVKTKITTSRNFILALTKMMKSGNYNHDLFLKRLESQSTRIRLAANTQHYLDILLEIYYYNSRKDEARLVF